MAYVNFDHAGWMETHLASMRRRGKSVPESLNEFQKRVVNIVGIVGGGIYNAPINPDKIDWNYGYGVSMVWRHGDMATWDFNRLTWLVFLCHEARIRCQIDGCGPRSMRFSFWQRHADGGMASRHPNLDEAIKAFREAFPADHQINYRETPSTAPAETVTVG